MYIGLLVMVPRIDHMRTFRMPTTYCWPLDEIRLCYKIVIAMAFSHSKDVSLRGCRIC